MSRVFSLSGANGSRLDLQQDVVELPYQLDAVGGAAGLMAAEVSRVTRTPASLAGSCVLGTLSASLGAGLEIISGAHRVTRGNLYLLPAAESGTGKSEVFRQLVEPLLAYEAELVTHWRDNEKPGLDAERDVLEAEIASLRKSSGRSDSTLSRETTREELRVKKQRLQELDRNVAPIFVVEDITSERLATLLAARGEQLASLSPDAGSVVNVILGKYSKLDRTDESLYLKCFSGDHCRVDRQRGDPVVLRHPCLTCLWFTQPDKLLTLLGEVSLSDGGLLPRFLLCDTRATPQLVEEIEATYSENVRETYRQLIRALLDKYRRAESPLKFAPTPTAKRLLDDYQNDVARQRSGDLADVNAYAARWGEQGWRLSVVLHAAEHGDQAHLHELQVATAGRALALVEWYSQQQLEVLEGGRWERQRKTARAVDELLLEHPEITARLIQQYRIAPDAKSARRLLKQMESGGRLVGRDHTPEKGGWTVRVYQRASSVTSVASVAGVSVQNE